MDRVATLRERFAQVSDEVAAAAARAGRSPADVRILVATKYTPLEDVPLLAEAGITLMGENRAQDLEAKATAHAGLDLTWHFIGQLQSRKVKQILPHVDLIHSVASRSALRELDKHGTADTEVLIEVNVAGEESKAGIAPEELGEYLERATVRVRGLMTMPPADGDSRRWFAALRELAERHGLRELSMGTSQDFAVAVEEGATIVRVGNRVLE